MTYNHCSVVHSEWFGGSSFCRFVFMLLINCGMIHLPSQGDATFLTTCSLHCLHILCLSEALESCLYCTSRIFDFWAICFWEIPSSWWTTIWTLSHFTKSLYFYHLLSINCIYNVFLHKTLKEELIWEVAFTHNWLDTYSAA